MAEQNTPASTTPVAATTTGGTNGGEPAAAANTATTTAPETFTQDQVNKIISDRLEKEQVKLTKKFEERLATEKAETERLAALSAEDKQKELLSKQQSEYETRKKELDIRDNSLRGQEKLAELKVPKDFIKYLVSDDTESMEVEITSFAELWSKSLSEAVANATKGTAPKDVKTGNSVIPAENNNYL